MRDPLRPKDLAPQKKKEKKKKTFANGSAGGTLHVQNFRVLSFKNGVEN